MGLISTVTSCGVGPDAVLLPPQPASTGLAVSSTTVAAGSTRASASHGQRLLRIPRLGSLLAGDLSSKYFNFMLGYLFHQVFQRGGLQHFVRHLFHLNPYLAGDAEVGAGTELGVVNALYGRR